MAKYIFRTEETHYLTYEIDVPYENEADVIQYFYDVHQDKHIIDRECFEYELVEVTKVEPKEKEVSHV